MTTTEPRAGQVWEHSGALLRLRSRSTLGTDRFGAVASVVGWEVEHLNHDPAEGEPVGWIVEAGLERDGTLTEGES